MTALVVTLIIIGFAFVIVSFFVEEKLSKKDVDRIISLSDNELKIIVEKQLSGAGDQIEDVIADSIEASMEITKRAMEKETNEKIMAINEFSGTVMDSMNKTHNEILFLYSMLNDKHTELTQLAKQMGQFFEQVKNRESEVLENLQVAAREIEAKVHEPELLPGEEKPAGDESLAEEEGSRKEMILSRYKEGMLPVEIAKELGMGFGEVMLVIGLYKGEEESAV